MNDENSPTDPDPLDADTELQRLLAEARCLQSLCQQQPTTENQQALDEVRQEIQRCVRALEGKGE